MKNLTLLFLSISIFAAFSHGIEVECDYNESGGWWGSSHKLYHCSVKSIHITTPNINIEKFNGENQAGKDNSNVEVFRISGQPKIVNYFPKNIENFFPNLKHINLYDVELKEIYQNDLKPFPLLEVLYVDYNKIEYLEKELLKFNTNLRGFSARGNPITFIHPTVFDHLSDFNYLFLSEISCVSDLGFVGNNRTKVLKMIQTIKSECSNGVEYYGELIKKLINKNSQETDKNEQLEEKIAQLDDKISTQLLILGQKLIDQLEKITSDIQKMQAKVEGLENSQKFP